MDRRLVAVAFVALMLAGVVASFFVLRDGGEDDEGLAAMSTRGRPIELAIPEQLGPWGDVTGEVLLIGERAGLRFLRLPRKDGSSCWGAAERRSGLWNLTEFSCETGLTRFPDPMRPLIVLGRLQADAEGLLTYNTFAGIAADGVERVAYFDGQGRLIPVTDVVDNVFFTPDPPGGIKQLAALDAAGEVVWRGGGVQVPEE